MPPRPVHRVACPPTVRQDRVEESGDPVPRLTSHFHHRRHQALVGERIAHERGDGCHDDGEHRTSRELQQQWIAGAEKPLVEPEKPHRRKRQDPGLRSRPAAQRLHDGGVHRRQRRQAKNHRTDDNHLKQRRHAAKERRADEREREPLRRSDCEYTPTCWPPSWR